MKNLRGFNSSVTSCGGSRTRGGAASHPREQISFPPAVDHPLNEAIRTETSQSVLFLDSSQGSELPLFFSIREVASATMLAGDM
jgi:hypothetical protein